MINVILSFDVQPGKGAALCDFLETTIARKTRTHAGCGGAQLHRNLEVRIEQLSGEKVNIARLPEAAVSPELEGELLEQVPEAMRFRHARHRSRGDEVGLDANRPRSVVVARRIVPDEDHLRRLEADRGQMVEIDRGVRLAPAVVHRAGDVIDVLVDFSIENGFTLNAAGLVRTARKLADGNLYVPRSVWKGPHSG